jgi:hypothetical protein
MEAELVFQVPEAYRQKSGAQASDESYGNNGAFLLTGGDRDLFCIASDGGGWEHVSVHAIKRQRSCTPTWEEMCRVKDAFWDGEDVVMQLHPRRSQYVNCHPHTLHLWRPTTGIAIPEPPAILVGPRRRRAGR